MVINTKKSNHFHSILVCIINVEKTLNLKGINGSYINRSSLTESDAESANPHDYIQIKGRARIL